MTPPRPGDPVPGLYCPLVDEPDPVTVTEVDARIADWVAREDTCPSQWRDDLTGFATGRATVLQYPDYASLDHLVAAAELLAAENVIGDCYVEDFRGSPEGLGDGLAIAQSALDAAHLTSGYDIRWDKGVSGDEALRSYRTAMRDFEAIVGTLRGSTPPRPLPHRLVGLGGRQPLLAPDQHLPLHAPRLLGLNS